MARQMKDSGVVWLGKVPEKWEVVKFKIIMRKRKELCHRYANQNILSLTMNGVIVRDLINPKGKMPASFDGYQIVEKGNLLLCLFDIDVTPRCVGLIKDDGLTSPAYSQYVLEKNKNPRFYEYILTYLDNEKVLLHLTKSLRNTLTDEDFGVVKTVLPSIEEQKRIVNFLDRKTDQINSLINDTKQSVVEFKKYKQALITETITKGLNSNVKFKDSGIEWIGLIPEHWGMVKLKYLLKKERNSMKVGPFGTQLKGSDFIENGMWVYNQRTVLDKNFETNNTFISKEKYDELNGFKVEEKDILLTTRGSIGKICRVPEDFNEGVIHPCLIKFKIEDNLFNYSLLERVFNESDFVKNQFVILSNSTTIDVIYSGTLKNIILPEIPLEEQQQITEFLNEKCAHIDSLIEQKQQLLIELEAYKKSFIYEYVTGKKEVL